MQNTLIYIFGSVALVSILSVVGILALLLKKKQLNSILLLLVAFSAGALLGGALLHLIPEASHHDGFTTEIALYILTGILIFFILEKIIHWHHCHNVDCSEHKHHLGTMNLVGDGLHNFIDGALIAGSYMVSIPLGIATTIAVILHEIPQEIGDFGVLVYSGMKPKKALFYNFGFALFAVAGAIIAILIGSKFESFSEIIIPITAGGFIYIASSDLIPELHKEVKIRKSLTQIAAILLGISLMALLATSHSHDDDHHEHEEDHTETIHMQST